MPDADVQVRVLGPVGLAGPGAAELPARLRRLLAALLVAGGSVVSTDRLVDVLWGDDPPEDPDAALHSLLARLRSRLRPPHGGPRHREPGGRRPATTSSG